MSQKLIRFEFLCAVGFCLLQIQINFDQATCCMTERSSIPGKGGEEMTIFYFPIGSRPVVGPTQPSIHRVAGSFSWSKAAGGVKLTTHLFVAPRLRNRESVPQLPNTSSRRGT
jgi:hypothetical protein